MTTGMHDGERSIEAKNKRLLRILLGIVTALVLTCFAIGTRW
jgi:hypothetical protein